MPTLDPHEHPLKSLLEPVFSALEEDGEVDLYEVPDDSAFEVQADNWTLHLAGWPVTTGFVALDEEPHSHAERLLALDAAIDQRHLAALRRANTLLEGEIARVLTASGDDLSILLAGALTDIVELTESPIPEP
jgi:hypothetical protein